MRIGVRAHDYGKHSPSSLASQLREAGFNATQLAIPKAIQGIENFKQIDVGLLEKIRTSFEAHEVELTVLGCYIEPALSEKEARLEQLSTFFKALEYSKIVDAKLVGTETTHFAEGENNRKEVFNLLVDSVLRMVEKAEQVDAYVGVEPVAVHTLNTPELTYKLLQKVKSDRLKIIFDPVNLLTLGDIDNQPKLWKECFEAFGKEIEAVHVKDIIIQDNQFNPVVLGTGIVKYKEIFDWLNAHKPHVSILREEANPVTVTEDIKFLNKQINK